MDPQGTEDRGSTGHHDQSQRSEVGAMELEDLSPHTRLPIDRIASALKNVDVRSMLPAISDRTHDLVVAATPDGLAIVRGGGGTATSREEVIVTTARWSQVRLGFDLDRADDDDDPQFGLVIRVGRQALHAVSNGPNGQKVLREFVVAAQQCIRKDAIYSDYDAATMLTR
jgi:hypothetical protein